MNIAGESLLPHLQYFHQARLEFLFSDFVFACVVVLAVELLKLVLVLHEFINVNSLGLDILDVAEHLVNEVLRVPEFPTRHLVGVTRMYLLKNVLVVSFDGLEV
jgi:hypothetical protein